MKIQRLFFIILALYLPFGFTVSAESVSRETITQLAQGDFPENKLEGTGQTARKAIKSIATLTQDILTDKTLSGSKLDEKLKNLEKNLATAYENTTTKAAEAARKLVNDLRETAQQALKDKLEGMGHHELMSTLNEFDQSLYHKDSPLRDVLFDVIREKLVDKLPIGHGEPKELATAYDALYDASRSPQLIEALEDTVTSRFQTEADQALKKFRTPGGRDARQNESISHGELWHLAVLNDGLHSLESTGFKLPNPGKSVSDIGDEISTALSNSFRTEISSLRGQMHDKWDSGLRRIYGKVLDGMFAAIDPKKRRIMKNSSPVLHGRATEVLKFLTSVKEILSTPVEEHSLKGMANLHTEVLQWYDEVSKFAPYEAAELHTIKAQIDAAHPESANRQIPDEPKHSHHIQESQAAPGDLGEDYDHHEEQRPFEE